MRGLELQHQSLLPLGQAALLFAFTTTPAGRTRGVLKKRVGHASLHFGETTNRPHDEITVKLGLLFLDWLGNSEMFFQPASCFVRQVLMLSITIVLGWLTVIDEGETDNNLAHFYQACLTEWMRVLVTGGRLAILIDVDNVATMMQAMQVTGSLRIQVHREPFRLGRLQATVIVAVICDDRMMMIDSGSATMWVEPSTVLPWEGDGRLESFTCRLIAVSRTV